MISQEQADRIEVTLAKVMEMLEERAKMLPRMPSVPASEPNYEPAPLPSTSTFSVEEAVGSEAEVNASGDDQLKRAVEAHLNASPSQADVWTVLIQFFPLLKSYIREEVQNFEGAVLRAFRAELKEEDD